MEDKSNLMKCAALFGLYMGLFWAVKYLFVVLGAKSDYFSAMYMGFTAAVPFIAYRFTLLYRDQAAGKDFSFYHAWQFGVMLYTFAAVVVSLVHFCYYKYILGPDGVAEIMAQTLSLLSSSGVDSKLMEQAKLLATPSPFQMTLQGILNNVFGGIVLSIPVALLAKRKSKTT